MKSILFFHLFIAFCFAGGNSDLFPDMSCADKCLPGLSFDQKIKTIHYSYFATSFDQKGGLRMSSYADVPVLNQKQVSCYADCWETGWDASFLQAKNHFIAQKLVYPCDESKKADRSCNLCRKDFTNYTVMLKGEKKLNLVSKVDSFFNYYYYLDSLRLLIF